MLFAKRLSTLDLNEINAADRMAQTPNKLKHGHVDDDALTFAIFTHDGRMSLTMAITEKIFLIAISGKVLLTGNWSVKTIPGVLSG
ncbi:two-component system sensor kinase [Escherichia coli]|uniref:Two-component system sensor kinase n=1 Tax=Escherichia coli TaxID=562 RepID=A0A376VWI3_ECOLX|nr:two-component system sensor kinase [Escherichia coli]